MSEPDPAIPYANPRTATPRRACRLAYVSLALALVAPASACVILAAERAGMLPQHFLCCMHPEVPTALLVLAPLAGSVAGAAALVRIRANRGALRGYLPAMAGLCLGAACATLGYGVTMGLKA